MTAGRAARGKPGSSAISVVAPPGSLGIRWYAQSLVAAMRADDVDVRLADRAPGRERLHLHLGNSTRRLIPAAIVARRPSLITVHDVVPRDPRLRKPWRLVAPRLFAGHRLIAHSTYARSLLRGLGVRAPVDVVRLAINERRLSEELLAATRADLSPDGRPIALCAGAEAGQGRTGGCRGGVGLPRRAVRVRGRSGRRGHPNGARRCAGKRRASASSGCRGVRGHARGR